MEDRDYEILLDCIECPYELEPGQTYRRKGLVGRLDGFKFVVHSNDHGKHFHVIHEGRGVDARFSFPEIELIDYKLSKDTIHRKEEHNIQVFFKNEEYFTKLKNEFDKRS